MSFTISDYNLCDSFATERKLLLFTGFYPRRDKNHRNLYLLSAFLNLLISYGQLVTMIIQMVLDRTDISKLNETLLYFFTHFTFLCKLFNFQYYEKDLLEIEDFLTDEEFYGSSFEQLQIIKDKIRWCDIIANIFRCSCSCTLTFYSLVPFIDASMKGKLPLPGWFPYDVSDYYASTYIAQIASVMISAYCNTTIDILTWKMITLVSAQFEILKENLTRINFEEESKETRDLLVKCVRHHRHIIILSQKVQAVFSKGIFLQMFCSCLVICTTGFQMMLVPIPSIQFAFSLSYLCGMTGQVATYCWYGHDVMTTVCIKGQFVSDKIGTSLYMSNWYMCDAKIRKIIVTFMENIKKATLIKAGDFIPVSLATLTQILRSAYSYFAVLQRLYNENNLL